MIVRPKLEKGGKGGRGGGPKGPAPGGPKGPVPGGKGPSVRSTKTQGGGTGPGGSRKG